MKFGLIILLLFAILFVGCGTQNTNNEKAGTEEEPAVEDNKKGPIASPRKQVEGIINGVTVKIDYGSPAVKDRDIWGGLEPYGKVWRAGANETTSIEFDKNVQFGDIPVSAGKYGFFLLLQESEPWIAIINTDWSREEHGAWGAYNYSPDHDLARIAVTPIRVNENRERLTYEIDTIGITLAWEKVRLTMPIKALEAK